MANVLSSIGNLALSVAITRAAPIQEVGIFGIAFAIYLLVRGFIQASVTDSVISHVGDPELYRRACRRVSLIGLVATAATALIGAFAGLNYLTILGCCFHGLLICDYVRSVSMAVGRPWRAVLQDAVWTTATIPLAALAFVGSLSPATAFLGWCISGGLVGYLSAWRQLYQIAPSWRYRLHDSRAFFMFGFGFMVSSGLAQVTPVFLAGVAGLAVVGALRGGSTVFGPVGIVTGTFQLLLIPSMGQVIHTSAKVVFARSIRMTMLVLCIMAPLLSGTYLLSHAFGPKLFRTNWTYVSPLIMALTIEALFIAIAAVPYAGLRVLRAGKQTLILRTLVGVTRVVLVIVLGGWLDASGAAIGMGISAGLSTVAAWATYYSAVLRMRDCDNHVPQ